MPHRSTDIRFTEKEIIILATVFQHMKGPLQVDWDTAARALGHANAGSLRSYWGQIRRGKIDPYGSGSGSGVRKRKWGGLGEGNEDGEGIEDGERAGEGEMRVKKRKTKAGGDGGGAPAVGRGGCDGGDEREDAARGGRAAKGIEGGDRPVKVEEDAAAAEFPVISRNDGHAADVAKIKKKQLTNGATTAPSFTKSQAGGRAAAAKKKKRTIDDDKDWFPALPKSNYIGHAADTTKVNEQKSKAGTAPAPIMTMAYNGRPGADVAIFNGKKVDALIAAAPFAPTGRAAAPDAGKDKRQVIAGGTMTPRRHKSEQQNGLPSAQKTDKKKSTSMKHKSIDLRPDDPNWTDYKVRKPKEADAARKDRKPAGGGREKIDDVRRSGSQRPTGRHKKVNAGLQDNVQPVDAGEETIKEKPDAVASVETGSGEFDPGFADAFGPFSDDGTAPVAAVAAPSYNDGYFGNAGFDGKTDSAGSFSVKTDPDDGGFFQAAWEGFVAGHGLPSDKSAGHGYHSNEYMAQSYLSDEYVAHELHLDGQIRYDYPQSGGVANGSYPAYDPVGYAYGSAVYGFGPVG